MLKTVGHWAMSSKDPMTILMSLKALEVPESQGKSNYDCLRIKVQV